MAAVKGEDGLSLVVDNAKFCGGGAHIDAGPMHMDFHAFFSTALVIAAISSMN